MTEEVEEQGFEHLEDVGWDYEADSGTSIASSEHAQCRTRGEHSPERAKRHGVLLI